MTDVNKITWDEVGTAHDASRTLLQIAKSHPPSICMGALIMATPLAARSDRTIFITPTDCATLKWSMPRSADSDSRTSWTRASESTSPRSGSFVF